MCAINGITWSDKGLVHKMNKSNSSRGPDASDIKIIDGVTLGHNLLIINSENLEEATQPSVKENSALVYNGEIYDVDHSEELDTQWLHRTLDSKGLDALNDTNGQWAFAYLKENFLYLGRDHFGAKPLYYSITPKGLIFSSTTKAILETGVVSSEMGEEFTEFKMSSYFQCGRATTFKHIHKLAPGEWLKFDVEENKISTRGNFWEGYNISKKEPYDHFEFRTKVLEAIYSTCRTSQEMSLLLSGGLDSTLIASILGLSNTENFFCATLTYDKDKKLDSNPLQAMINEVDLAKITTEEYDINHLISVFPAEQSAIDEYAHKCLNVAGAVYEDSYRMIPRMYILEKIKKKGGKVVLNGDGGDEIFTGYNKHRDWLEPGKKPTVKDASNAIKKYNVAEWFPMEVFKGSDPLTALMFIDVLTQCETYLMRADAFCGSLGMESRSPFLYQDLVKYTFHIPLATKLQFRDSSRKGIHKFLIRDVFADVIPEEIRNRRNKLGWSLPYWRKDPKSASRRREKDMDILKRNTRK